MERSPDFSNSAYLFPHVNPKGLPFGFAALAVALAAAVGTWWCCHLAWAVVPLFLLAYGVFLFFRDPERYPPEDPKAILSPADGRVCLVARTALPDELGVDDGKEYWRVSVFMSVFNVHVNRLPTAGKIVKKAYVEGKFFNASLDKASKDNERCAWLVETPGGVRYAVVQIAGLVARRIVPFVKEGDELERAQRFGLIRFGSRLDVYLPEGVEPVVRVGQIMNSGETVLGRFA